PLSWPVRKLACFRQARAGSAATANDSTRATHAAANNDNGNFLIVCLLLTDHTRDLEKDASATAFWLCPCAMAGPSPRGGAGGGGGRRVRGEFATSRHRWRTGSPAVTPCPPSACVACWGRVRHFATLSAVRNCPLPAPRPEIPPAMAILAVRGP